MMFLTKSICYPLLDERITQMTEPIAVSIPEATRLSGVGRSTIYSEVKAGSNKVRKIGRRTIIAMDDLRKWLNLQIWGGVTTDDRRH